MPLIIMSTPPVEFEPYDMVMCDVCGNSVEEWVAVRIITDLVHICGNCLVVLTNAYNEMHRQWLVWRDNYATEPTP